MIKNVENVEWQYKSIGILCVQYQNVEKNMGKLNMFILFFNIFNFFYGEYILSLKCLKLNEISSDASLGQHLKLKHLAFY